MQIDLYLKSEIGTDLSRKKKSEISQISERISSGYYSNLIDSLRKLQASVILGSQKSNGLEVLIVLGFYHSTFVPTAYLDSCPVRELLVVQEGYLLVFWGGLCAQVKYPKVIMRAVLGRLIIALVKPHGASQAYSS
jgi:hypothetical protein